MTRLLLVRLHRYVGLAIAGFLALAGLTGSLVAFQPELDAEPCRYGLVKNLATFNILRVAFHEWIATVQDVVRHPRHALGYIFGPPGWSHDGSRETSAMIKARALASEAPQAGAREAA